MANASVEPLHQPPAPREVLAVAIARRVAALENVERVNKVHADAEQAVYKAHAALKAAEEAHTEAETNEGSRLASVALGEEAGMLSDDAELSVTIATDTLMVARRTRDALLVRSDREAAALAKVEREIDEAITNIIKTEAPITALLEGARELQAELTDVRLQLRWLQTKNCVPVEAESAVRGFLLSNTLPSGVGGIDHGHWSGDRPATQRWRAVVEKLREDPSAPLPTSS